ncbi:MAG: hypothetical protein ABSA49_09365 [Rhizomicrobium sp.]
MGEDVQRRRPILRARAHGGSHVRHRRQEANQIRKRFHQPRDRVAKRRQQQAHFVHAAARQHGQHRRICGNAKTVTQRIASRHAAGALDHRVSDESGMHAMRLEKRRFERKQRQHEIEIAAHLARAILARCPDLRRHIIDRPDRGIAPLQSSCDAMGEIRAVDQDDRVGPRRQRKIGCLAHAAEYFRNPRHHLAQPHHRSIVEREKTPETLRRHGRAADAYDSKPVTRKSLQTRHQLGAELVTGRLAADEHQSQRWKRAVRHVRRNWAARRRQRGRPCPRSRPLRAD